MCLEKHLNMLHPQITIYPHSYIFIDKYKHSDQCNFPFYSMFHRYLTLKVDLAVLFLPSDRGM